MKEVFEKLDAALSRGEDAVLVSILSDVGSAPRGKGAQMLVGEGGRLCGTVGGGNVEFLALQMAEKLLKEGRCGAHRFPLHPGEGDIGMVCGGEVEVLMQFISGKDIAWHTLAKEVCRRIDAREAAWLVLRMDGSGELSSALPAEESGALVLPLPIGERAVIFGGGHCARALVPILKTVGFRVTVMECRGEFACRDLFPDAEEVLLGDYTRIAETLTLTPEDYVVVLTSGHTFDLEVETQVLPLPLAYIGVIGSRSKTAAVNRVLRERGISEEAIARVHTPIGTPIKAVTPEEIAVSIAGEMIYERALRREAQGEERGHGCPMHE